MKRRLREHFKDALPTAFLLLAVLLGGASGARAGVLANGFLQALSLLVILYCLWAGRKANLPGDGKPLVWLVSLFIGLVLLSLIPLPPGVWQQFPGRERAAAGLALIGMPGQALPQSLAPQSTLASLTWLLPPVAAFLLVLEGSSKARKLLVGGILAAGIVSVALGVAQLVSGPHALRPYVITNPGRPVGFFANANHFGTLLLCALPFCGYIAARAVRRASKARKASGTALAVSTALFLIIGIVILRSVAGYGLLLVTLAATFLIYRRAAVGMLSRAWVAGVAALFLVFLALASTGPLQEQAITGKLSDQRTSRKVMAATTVEAIKDTFPSGTGLGSFPQVYRTYEDQNAVGTELVNHAHNDYLEFALELGLAAVVLIIGFILWWGRQTIRAWRASFEGADLGRAGSVVVLVVLLHSSVDYPIRTSAIAALFAVGCALMIPGSRAARRTTKTNPASEATDLRHLEAD